MIISSEYDIVKAVDEMKKLDFAEGPFLQTIEKYDPKNTTQQKRLYWDWVDTIRKQTGEFKCEQDELLRHAFLTPIYYENAKGQEKKYYKRISELGKKEMADFMDDVLIAATRRGYKLKVPEDAHVE